MGLLETNPHLTHIKIPKELFLHSSPWELSPYRSQEKPKDLDPLLFDTEVGLYGLVFIPQRTGRLFHIKGLTEQET